MEKKIVKIISFLIAGIFAAIQILGLNIQTPDLSQFKISKSAQLDEDGLFNPTLRTEIRATCANFIRVSLHPEFWQGDDEIFHNELVPFIPAMVFSASNAVENVRSAEKAPTLSAKRKDPCRKKTRQGAFFYAAQGRRPLAPQLQNFSSLSKVSFCHTRGFNLSSLPIQKPR
jgi:hypothetical protein